MPNLHPLLVHFPIALLTLSFLFDAVSAVTRKPQFERSGWWTLLSGSIGLGLTITSGLFAEGTVTIGEEAREHFDTHEEIAFVVATVYVVLLLWRIANKSLLPVRRRGVYLFLSLVGCVLIWLGAWYGGELVYRFGVGVHLK